MKKMIRSAAAFMSLIMLLSAAGCAGKPEPLQPNIEVVDNVSDASDDSAGTVELRTYTCDDDGEWVVTNEFIRSKDGKTHLLHRESTGYREYVYDCEGRKVLETGYTDNCTDITDRQETEYDACGNLVRETYLKGTELMLSEEYVYSYDERGQVQSYTHSDGTDTVRFENIRDELGRVTELMYSAPDGEMARFSSTEYAPDGSFVTYYYTQPSAQDSMPDASGVHSDTESQAEPLAEGHYSADGLCESEYNYALSYEAEYRHDENGNLKEKVETFCDGWLRTTYIRGEDGGELERIEEDCRGNMTRYLSKRANKGKPIKFHYSAYHESVEGYTDVMAEALEGTEFEDYGDELTAAEIKELELNDTYIIYNYTGGSVSEYDDNGISPFTGQPYGTYVPYSVPVGGSSGYSNESPDIGWALTHSPGYIYPSPGPQPAMPGTGALNPKWPGNGYSNPSLPPFISLKPVISSSGYMYFP